VFEILFRMYESRIFKRDVCIELTRETRETELISKVMTKMNRKKNIFILQFILIIVSCNEKQKSNPNLFCISCDFNDRFYQKDTNYFFKAITDLDTTVNKNDFYSQLSIIYNTTGRVVVNFDDSCQGELFLVFNDNEIDSPKEIMNKKNIIKGLYSYTKSKLFFRCNFNEDKVENIAKKYWKSCNNMSDKDFDLIRKELDNYALTLPKCDTCYTNPIDKTKIKIHCNP
jgi:hypothetical protein